MQCYTRLYHTYPPTAKLTNLSCSCPSLTTVYKPMWSEESLLLAVSSTCLIWVGFHQNQRACHSFQARQRNKWLDQACSMQFCWEDPFWTQMFSIHDIDVWWSKIDIPSQQHMQWHHHPYEWRLHRQRQVPGLMPEIGKVNDREGWSSLKMKKEIRKEL